MSLDAGLDAVQRASVAHALHFISNQAEAYYEAVRRAAHMAGARPEMFLLRAVFALDLTRVAVPRGGAIPLASLPNAATEHPKLRRAVPQPIAGLEPAFQETLQRLVSSIDINRQFVVWLTVEGEGLGAHDLGIGRSVHAGAVIDALDHRPTWVGHLGGRVGSAGDNMIPPHRFTTTADGRVLPEAGAARQQQQQQQQHLAAMQQRFGPHVAAIPSNSPSSAGMAVAQQFQDPQALRNSQYFGHQQQQLQHQQQQQSPLMQPGGGGGIGSPWGSVAIAGGYQQPQPQQHAMMMNAMMMSPGAAGGAASTPPMSALSGMSPSALTASSDGLTGAAVAGGASPSTSLFASPQQQQQQQAAAGGSALKAMNPALAAVKSRPPGGGGVVAQGQMTGETLDKIDEFLAVSHMCTKASTKCIEQLGTFNVRLDELHNYTSTLSDKFDGSRTESKALSGAVDQLMQKVQAAEKHMLLLESPKPIVRAPTPPKKDLAAAETQTETAESDGQGAAAAAAAAAAADAEDPELRFSQLEACPYCKRPGSRYCMNSGRRHETPDEKVTRRWKHVFRSMALLSSVVSTMRLGRKNTCVDDGSVELLL